jgi:MFS transporter, DHA1 family, multidrug resistance protein
MLGLSIFTIGSATAKDIQTLIICRFFAGVCGASPLCVVPGVLSDVYAHTSRGVAISIYSLTVFGGPLLGPVVGSFVAKSYLGWRWTLYLPAILGSVNTLLLIFTLDESFAPIILVRKAARLRKQTGDWAYISAHERMDFDIAQLADKYFLRPVKMLIFEPMMSLVTLYMSFVYGIVYALLEAYPYVFEHTYKMQPGNADLPFLGLLVGVCCALGFILRQQHTLAQKLAANNGELTPEWRLTPALFGAFAFPAGLFWFAWTAFTPAIHFMVPVAAGVMIGFGVLCVFLSCFNYIVDAYLPIAASAVAANIMLRSSVAAGFPLFARQMFVNLGVQWAGTLLGCLAVLMLPIPFCFRRFGQSLRRKSNLLHAS